MTPRQQKIQQRFTNDPDWVLVEEEINEYIAPLMNYGTIDLTQPAEHVKAEVIARSLAHNALADFLNTTLMVGDKQIKRVDNPFR